MLTCFGELITLLTVILGWSQQRKRRELTGHEEEKKEALQEERRIRTEVYESFKYRGIKSH